MNQISTLFFTALLFPLFAFGADTIKLTAQVDNTSLRVGERFTYTVQADYSGSLPDIQPPDFNGFDVVGGPSVSTSVQIINMSVTKSQTLSYILRPNRSGSLTINPASLKVRSKTISSNSVTLEVASNTSTQTPPTAKPQGGVNGQSLPQGDKLPEVFLTATTDKSNLTKQDMAVVTYRLYLRVNVLNYEIAKLPQATGFWIEDFPVSARPILEDVTVRGQPYKVATIRKSGVFPTRAGNLILDPLTIDVTIERPGRRGRDSFFDDPFFGNRGSRLVQSVTCDPLTLSIRDFPGGAPASFSGDVGSFEVKVNYDKETLSQNDALTVKVSISGRGYLKSVDAPKLELPSGFEQFTPTVDDNVSLVGEAMRGKKTFTYLVIPRRSGTFVLPAVKFTFLDPATNSYQTLAEGGLTLNVTPSSGGDQESYTARSPSEVTLIDSDIRFVKSLNEPLTRGTTPPYRSPLFYILLAVWPLGFISGIGWEKYYERLHSDPIQVRRRRAVEGMRQQLLEAEKYASGRDALKAAESAAKGLAELACAVIKEPTAGVTTELIERKLLDAGAETQLVSKTISLLGEADRIRFGGSGQTVEDINQMLGQFKAVAGDLEKLP